MNNIYFVDIYVVF